MATIRVSGTGNNITFEENKMVLIQRQGNGIFVQTDKPIYNPGQRGKRQKIREMAAHICKEGLFGVVVDLWNNKCRGEEGLDG